MVQGVEGQTGLLAQVIGSAEMQEYENIKTMVFEIEMRVEARCIVCAVAKWRYSASRRSCECDRSADEADKFCERMYDCAGGTTVMCAVISSRIA